MTCPYCKKDMTKVDSCVFPFVKFAGQFYDRLEECYADLGERCPDCSILVTGSNNHHPGCDNERCPKCHLQALGCDCEEYEGHWTAREEDHGGN